MKLHGYCTGCRKIKRVQVTGLGVASVLFGGALEGVCDDCDDIAPHRLVPGYDGQPRVADRYGPLPRRKDDR